MKKYWDHSTKPSTYVVCVPNEEPFRGSYQDGMLYIKSLNASGMISFKDDYIPSTAKNCLPSLNGRKAVEKRDNKT